MSEPTPQPSSTPAQPATPQQVQSPGGGASPAAPPPASAPQPQVPDLNANSSLIVADSDGSERVVTLGEMAQAWQARGNQLSAEDAENLEMFKGLIKSDPQAMQSFVSKFLPKNTPAPEPSALQEKIDRLEQTVQSQQKILEGEFGGLMTQIRTAQESNTLKQHITARAATLPHLSRVPNAEKLAANKLQEFKQVFKTRGGDYDKMLPENQIKVQELAVQQCEQELAAIAESWGLKPQQAQPQHGPFMTDNQPANPNRPGYLPSMYSVAPNGSLISTQTGQVLVGPNGTIPTQPTSEVPSGSAPGPQPSQPQGPYTKEQSRQMLRERVQMMGS